MSGEWFGRKNAVERGASKPRLAAFALKAIPAPLTSIDNTRARELLEMTPWKTSVLDVVENFLQLEKEWLSKGLTIRDPYPR
ncbi:hypothetical protein SCP_0303790 [Sparassis crispa]|uniref:Uncharacterized protein n=1 Tax=Sparassis crispa TaxID=139825 RepID=A0A401GES1_9APHY|nr:hypothetical protein SCP_0303790 [Sparassis crispa]GBE80660.1 hypothetical protein SCP_0303790 [Sparassis crispa]